MAAVAPDLVAVAAPFAVAVIDPEAVLAVAVLPLLVDAALAVVFAVVPVAAAAAAVALPLYEVDGILNEESQDKFKNEVDFARRARLVFATSQLSTVNDHGHHYFPCET